MSQLQSLYSLFTMANLCNEYKLLMYVLENMIRNEKCSTVCNIVDAI